MVAVEPELGAITPKPRGSKPRTGTGRLVLVVHRHFASLSLYIFCTRWERLGLCAFTRMGTARTWANNILLTSNVAKQPSLQLLRRARRLFVGAQSPSSCAEDRKAFLLQPSALGRRRSHHLSTNSANAARLPHLSPKKQNRLHPPAGPSLFSFTVIVLFAT